MINQSKQKYLNKKPVQQLLYRFFSIDEKI
jgi:hypothetical protein